MGAAKAAEDATKRRRGPTRGASSGSAALERRLRRHLFRGHRYPAVLIGVYSALWLVLAIDPVDRIVWAGENALVVVAVLLLLLTSRYFRFSDRSYTFIFAFLVLHAIGAHFTYPGVPFDQALWGASRNNYDRLVHFAFGLLFVVPAREVFRRIADAKGFWSFYFPFEMTLAFSALFEVVEWGVVVVMAPEQGLSYLGAQGDAFDAVKDVAAAGVGALIATMLAALAAWHHGKRRFASEFEESLRIKRPDPDDEDDEDDGDGEGDGDEVNDTRR